jgi:hypothetical protein
MGATSRMSRRRGALLPCALLALACAAAPALHAKQAAQNPGQAAKARQQADAAFAQALQALQQRQWLQAELLLERTLMFYPAHAEALLQLALLLARAVACNSSPPDQRWYSCNWPVAPWALR